MDMTQLVTLIFSGVVALSTVIYAILTWRLAAETIRMRKAQTDPCVSIYLEQHPTLFHFFDLIIKNIGSGPAYDVTFIVLEDFDIPEGRKLSQIDFIKEGISYMPPDYQIRSYFLTFLGNCEKIIDKSIKVKVSYKNAQKNNMSEIISLNMSQFSGIQMLGGDPLDKIAKSMESIEKNVHHITTGFNHLTVDTYDSEDRAKLKEEREKQLTQGKK